MIEHIIISFMGIGDSQPHDARDKLFPFPIHLHSTYNRRKRRNELKEENKLEQQRL